MSRKKKPLKHRTLLIDADILIFRQAAAAEKTIKWDEETVSKTIEPIGVALDRFERTLADTLETSKCTDYFLCISHALNFRYAVLPTYKHNRTKDDPVHRGTIKDYCKEKHPFLCLPECEADDVLGIYATMADADNFVIATIDKDLMQIPGLHFDWRTGETFTVAEDEGEVQFLRQWLTGDSTDGYAGIPGFGPAKANFVLGLLDECRIKKTERPILEALREKVCNPYQKVFDVYAAYGVDSASCLQQGRVARILRAGDYNFKTKKVQLWTPKGVSL